MQKATPTYVLTRVAILVAISTVIKVAFSLTLSGFRITFYEIPLMILGLMFGPLLGLTGGLVGDIVNIVYPNLATGFNLMTVSAMMWGVIPGLFLFGRDNLTLRRVALVTIFTSIICFTINSAQLYIWTGPLMFAGLPIRIITLLVKLPIQILVLEILYRRVIVFDLKLLKQR